MAKHTVNFKAKPEIRISRYENFIISRYKIYMQYMYIIRIFHISNMYHKPLNGIKLKSICANRTIA